MCSLIRFLVGNELIDYNELLLIYEITDVVFGLYFALY